MSSTAAAASKAQLSLAATLLGHANNSVLDESDGHELTNRIRAIAAAKAHKALARLGTSAGECRDAMECLSVAMRLKP